MPQIWLDDEELADFTGLDPAQARIQAIRQGWTRMRSRSGLSRSRLPPELTQHYLHFLTQMPPASERATDAWAGLRKALVALMPGIGNASRGHPSHSLENDAKAGRSIAPPVLISQSLQSEAA